MKLNGHNPFGEGEKTTVKLEDIGGRFGFRVRWEFTDEGAAFVVWAILSRQSDGLQLALFAKDDEPGKLTPDTIQATPYISGCVRADGRWWVNANAVGRGPTLLKRHLSVVKYAWERGHELMVKKPAMPWKEA